MLWSKNSYPNILLPFVVYDADGTVKSNITDAVVRVYQIQEYSEVDILAEVDLFEVGDMWVYDWEPSETLEVGTYIVSGTFTDSLSEVRKIYVILYVTENEYILVNGTPFDPNGEIP